MWDNPKFQWYPVLPMPKNIRDDIIINKEKYWLVFDWKYRDWVKDNWGVPSWDLYTWTALTDVWGISNWQTFTDATMQEMWDNLLRPETFPTLVNPSIAFNHNQASLVEIWSVISIVFTADFNRWSISPAYWTSWFRSGSVNWYNYTGTLLPPSVTTTDDPRNDSITWYTVLSWANTWTASADYDIWEQPLSNKWNPYDSPLPAWNVWPASTTITWILPYFWGKVNWWSKPVADQTLIDSWNKVVATSNWTLTVPFNSSNTDWLRFAIPQWSISKTARWIDALNNWNIWTVTDLFGAEQLVNIDSPTALWTNENYKIYISNYQSEAIPPMDLLN